MTATLPTQPGDILPAATAPAPAPPGPVAEPAAEERSGYWDVEVAAWRPDRPRPGCW